MLNERRVKRRNHITFTLLCLPNQLFFVWAAIGVAVPTCRNCCANIRGSLRIYTNIII